MFTKYFGAFVVVAGVCGAVCSLMFNGLTIDRSGKLHIDAFDELVIGLVIALIIITSTSLVGRYFWKIGRGRESQKSEDLAEDKTSKRLTKLSIASIITAILLVPINFFVLPKICSSTDAYVCVAIMIFPLLVFPASWLGFVAVAFLLLRVFRKKIKESLFRFIYYFFLVVTVVLSVAYLALVFYLLFM